MLSTQDERRTEADANNPWRRWLSWLVLWTGAVAVALGVRLGVAGVGFGAPPDPAVAATQVSYLWLLPLRIAGYLRLLILPWPLSAYYTPSDFAPVAVWIAGGAAAAAAIAAGCVLLRQRIGWMGLVWTGVFLVPVLGFLPIDAAVLAERFLYLPSVGFCLILGGLYAMVRNARKSPAVDALAVGLLLSCAAATLIGQQPWRDGKTLSAHIVRTSPRAFVGHLNLGNSFTQEGRIAEAETEYSAAVEIAPARADAWNNLGAVIEHRGDEAGAVEAFRKASSLAPKSAIFSVNLANALVRLGHADEAEAVFRRVLAQDAGSPKARVGLADALEAGKKYREAAEALVPVAGTPDDDGGISLRCARLFRQAGETGKAGDVLQRAVSIHPADAGLLVELGTLAADQGRPEEAESLLARAVRAAPDRADAHSYLGFILMSRGRTAQAVEELREAARLDPKNPVVRQNLGFALLAEKRFDEARVEAEKLRELNPDMSRQLEIEILRARGRLSLSGRSRPPGP